MLRAVRSPQRGTVRDIDVYLPASYARGRRRYPVVYMQDGQNLSDPHRAFAGTWELDRAIATLASRGIETIVVGVPNMGEARAREYTPFVDAKMGGGDGDAYLAYLERTVKPMVDRRFRTQPDRDTTGIFGSSLGGLISLYAFFRAPETFGLAGAMSPSIWYANRALLPYVEHAGTPAGRLYVDTGTDEGPNTLRDARALSEILAKKGYSDDCLHFVEDHGGRHSEADWARRLTPALAFLLRPLAERRRATRTIPARAARRRS